MMRSLFRVFETWIDPFRPAPGDAMPERVVPFIVYFLSQTRWPFALMLVIGGLTGLVETALFYFVGVLVDTLESANRAAVWQEHGLMFALMAITVVVVRTVLVSLSTILAEQTIVPGAFALVRWQSHRRVLRQRLAFFQDDFAGRIATKVMQAGPAFGDFMIALLQSVWHFVIFVATTMALLASVDWRLALLLGVWFALYVVLLRVTLPELRRRAKLASDGRARLMGRLVDSYTNVQTVKLFAGAAREDAFVREGLERQQEAVLALARMVSGLRMGLTALNGVMITLAGLISVLLWQDALITVGAVAMTMGLVLRLNQMSGWMMMQVNGLFRDLGTLHDSIETVAQPIVMTDAPGARELPRVGGRIRLEHVSFGYGRQARAIHDLSLDIGQGEKVGIVGRSGAGKTTLVSLLLRLFDVDSGRILIDGIDIATVTQDSLRRAIGVVTQDTSLLHRSVYENIAYGRPDARQDEVEAAARKAAAHDFIQVLEDGKGRKGYEAQVGERGVKLSGGQRQRIAIARVLLKDAPILVLDEATSALDSEIEAAIQEQLYNLMEGKTVIAIAHRLSTIAAMDRLIVMDEGRIVEEGTHEALIAKGGLYAELWARQSGGFLLDAAAE